MCMRTGRSDMSNPTTEILLFGDVSLCQVDNFSQHYCSYLMGKKKSTCFLPQGETPHAKRGLFLQEPSDMGSVYHSIPIHLLVPHIIGKL